MKNVKLVVFLSLIITITSCKKTHIVTQADLMGKWTETQPYVNSRAPANSPIYNLPYILLFDSNNIVIETSPFQDTATYTLMTNNNLRLDCSIPESPSCYGFGSGTYAINGDANSLSVLKFSYSGSGSGQQTPINLNLIKTR